MAVIVRLILIAAIAAVAPLTALEWTSFEGPARGVPTLRDLSGSTIADGDFAQWIEGGRLHVRIRYAGRGRRIEERAVFRQRPQLAQQAWSLHEDRDGKPYRHFEIDFTSGTASAKKHEAGKEPEAWSEQVELDSGRAFAGFGFTMAVKALRTRVRRGQHVELQTVGFMPKPRVADIDVSYAGVQGLAMAGRTLRGERFVVHPKVPLIAKLFVDVPDSSIWLTPPPSAFMRFEGPLPSRTIRSCG